MCISQVHEFLVKRKSALLCRALFLVDLFSFFTGKLSGARLHRVLPFVNRRQRKLTSFRRNKKGCFPILSETPLSFKPNNPDF